MKNLKELIIWLLFWTLTSIAVEHLIPDKHWDMLIFGMIMYLAGCSGFFNKFEH